MIPCPWSFLVPGPDHHGEHLFVFNAQWLVLFLYTLSYYHVQMRAYDITHQIMPARRCLCTFCRRSARLDEDGNWSLSATVSRRITRIVRLLLTTTQLAPPAVLPRADCRRLRTLLGALVPADAQLAAAARVVCLLKVLSS